MVHPAQISPARAESESALPPSPPSPPALGRRLRLRLRLLRPYGLAAVVVAVAFCASGMYRRTVPFGPGTRSTNDLGDQSVPIHGYLRDLLLGHAEGDLLFNWRSGWGVSFLPDLYTYATSPFSLLVVLFPRNRMDDALFFIILLKMMVAAVAMVAFLRSTGRGPWWLLGLFGAGYGLCGWAIDDAAYVPQWLDGLVLFPLLCLVGRWRRDNRRFLLGVLVVGYGWLANFYTGYMATIAAGLVLVCGLLAESMTWRARLTALARFAATVLCGIAAVLPLLIPTYLAAKQSADSTVIAAPFTPVSWVDFLSRLLPATEGVGFSASIYVGTLALVLVAALPLHRGVPARTRVAWLLLVIALVASFRWTPTVTAWHLFDEPQGSSYREAFVLCGVLIIAGWQAVAAGLPRWPALAGGAGIVAAIAAFTYGGRFVHPRAWLVLAGSLLVVVAVLLGTRALTNRTGRWPMVFGAALALLAVLTSTVEQTVTAIVTDQRRDVVWYKIPTWGPAHDQRQAAVAEMSDFPRYRTDPGAPVISRNDPMLLGGQGAGYYSSLIPKATYGTLDALGFGVQNRVVLADDSPVLDAIFAVGGRVTSGPGGATATRQPAPPLVTVHPGNWQEPGVGESPLVRQQAILGRDVYAFPDTTVRIAGRTSQLPAGQARSLPAEADISITVNCGANQRVFAAVPGLIGLFQTGKVVRRAEGGTVLLGTTSPTGRLATTLRLRRPGSLPAHWVGCLDEAKLAAAVNDLTRTGARSVRVDGHRVDAVLPDGSTGVAVLSTTVIEGWRCSANGRDWATPGSYAGLVAVPIAPGSSRVSCVFEPPGLRAGLAAAGVVLLVVVLVLAAPYLLRRRRKRGQPVRPR
jgi:uncharacterized membrane protein YfhO